MMMMMRRLKQVGEQGSLLFLAHCAEQHRGNTVTVGKIPVG